MAGNMERRVCTLFLTAKNDLLACSPTAALTINNWQRGDNESNESNVASLEPERAFSRVVWVVGENVRSQTRRRSARIGHLEVNRKFRDWERVRLLADARSGGFSHTTQHRVRRQTISISLSPPSAILTVYCSRQQDVAFATIT